MSSRVHHVLNTVHARYEVLCFCVEVMSDRELDGVMPLSMSFLDRQYRRNADLPLRLP